MTREKWSKMTADKRRIKVAELCGWRSNGHGAFHRTRTFDGIGGTYTVRDVASLHPVGYDDCGGIGSPTQALPDYLNDLNAMHEVEKILLAKKVRRNQVVPSGVYQSLLIDATGGFAWCATAAQRAEAFVLTLEPEDE